MTKIAVDVVLLPSEEMMDKTIEVNRELLKNFDKKIILNKENCLPHISLAMGCIDKEHITDIEKILQDIAKQYSVSKLRVIDIYPGTDSANEQMSAFQIERTKELQLLHRKVMQGLAPYFTYDVTTDMLFSPPGIEKTILLWIKNYPEKSSFENFSPHITIGFGKMDNLSLPIEFTASKLALCRLGNHCTCRKILVSITLRGV